MAADSESILKRTASGPLTNLGLTLPLFVAYHVGVVWLPARNAADWMTFELVHLAEHSLQRYLILTVGIGIAYVGLLWLFAKNETLHWSRFGWLTAEAIVYAIGMRLIASEAVRELSLASPPLDRTAPLASAVMSFGAGFYEELAFRLLLFGVGFKCLSILFPLRSWLTRGAVLLGWAVVCSGAFSMWHHVGELGEPLKLVPFTYRAVCGLVFTAIYQLRGFAPAVWTHAVYDLWVLVPGLTS